MDSQESWLPVKGWEGSYEVSDRGRVRSVTRTIDCDDGRSRTFQGMILKQSRAKRGGYKVVSFPDGTFKVHVLVADAFIGPRPEGYDVRHKNGNCLDNRRVNLEYGTRAENIADAISHGTHQGSREVCPRDHPLKVPNLVPAELRRGGRTCWACAKAQGRIKNARNRGRPIPDLKTLSDEIYLEIMNPA